MHEIKNIQSDPTENAAYYEHMEDPAEARVPFRQSALYIHPIPSLSLI